VKYFKNRPTPHAGCGFGTILVDYAEPELINLMMAANF